MMYSYECETCKSEFTSEWPAFSPPTNNPVCHGPMQRIYGCAQIDTSSCKDHDEISQEGKVASTDFGPGKGGARNLEKRYAAANATRRKQLADGGNRGSFRHTHSVPAEFYHGKVRETGDPNYWKDSKNVARHRSTRVS